MIFPSPLNSNSQYKIGIEPYRQRLRIVIWKDEKEIACRKEDKKVLSSFCNTENESLFQGRIKLNSSIKYISVFFKAEFINSFEKIELKKVIDGFQ